MTEFWLQLTLHGDIESPKVLVRTAQAIIKEGLTDDEPYNATVRNLIDSFADCIGRGYTCQFSNSECNYANIDDLEQTLQDCGVSYSVDHAAGGEFGEACWSYSPAEGKHFAEMNGGSIMLGIGMVEKCMTQGLEVLQQHVDSARKASGGYLPQFTVSGRAERLILRVIAAKALLEKKTA